MDTLARRQRKARRHAGFTLIELLTVMAIMAVLLGLSIAAFRDMGRGAGMRGAVLQFKSALSLARQYAITHRQPTWLYLENESGVRGMYYMTTNVNPNSSIIGTTNYFSQGIVFGDPQTATNFNDSVEFKLDGSVASGALRRDFIISELGGSGNTVTTRVYKLTGRVKVLKGEA